MGPNVKQIYAPTIQILWREKRLGKTRQPLYPGDVSAYLQWRADV